MSSKTCQHLSQQILRTTLATLQLVAIDKEKVSVIEPTASEFSNFSKYAFFALTCKCITLWLTSKLPGKFSLDLITAPKLHTAEQSLSLFLLLFKPEKVLSKSAVLLR